MTAFKKKVLAFALAGTMALSSTGIAFGATSTEKFDKIVELGIIQGEGEGNAAIPTDTLSRYRAFVLQLRLIGKLEEFQNYDHTGKDTFKDASKYSPFVQKLSAYLKNNPEIGIKGYDDNTLKPMEDISAQEYIVIMLGALGYEAGEDFTWETAIDFAKSLGIVTTASTSTKAVTLKDASIYTYDTLSVPAKNGTGTLGEDLGYVVKDTLGAVVVFDKLKETVDTSKVTLTGSINEKATLKINGENVEVSKDLKFEKTVDLKVGENVITIETVDESGNVGKQEVKIKRVIKDLVVNEVLSDSNKQVKIEFNNELDPATVKAENFEIKNYTIGKVQLEDDKKTVTLMLSGQSVFDQQSKQTITKIENVKDIEGNTISKASNIEFYSKDLTLPEVVKVEVERNNEIRVTFSEPVQESQAINGSNYTLNEKRFVGTVKGYDYNTVVLSTKNLESENVLEVKDIKDFNKLTMDDQTINFSYTEDNTAPEVEEITDATLESVRIKFSEKIDFASAKKDNFKWAYSISSTSGKTATSIEKVDDTTIIAHFKGDNSLPPATVNLMINGVKDLSGNIIDKDTGIEVTATVDETRPEITSIITEYDGGASTTNNGNTKFTVNFSKKVLDADTSNNLANNFEIKDTNGKKLNKTITLKENYTASTNKIEFTVNDLKDGDYTLVVKNIKDDTKLANKMIDVEENFVVDNKRTPEVLGVFYEDNTSTDKLYVQYSEAMNSTITDASKYMVKKGSTWYKLSDELDGNITTMRNNTFAVIPLKNDFKSYTELEIALVENAAGNTISGTKLTFKLDEIKDINSAAPVIKYAEVTDKNQLKVYLDKEIADAYYKDFWITNESKTVAESVYHNQTSNYNFNTSTVKESTLGVDFNGNNNTSDEVTVSVVTINFNTDVFNSTGKFKSGEDIYIYNSSNILHTQDAFGNKLADGFAKAVDKTNATLETSNDRVNADVDNKKVVLTFDEAIVVGAGLNGYAANDLVITDNSGKTLVSGVDYGLMIVEGKVIITFNEAMEADYTISTANTINFIKDASGNLIKGFNNITIVRQ